MRARNSPAAVEHQPAPRGVVPARGGDVGAEDAVPADVEPVGRRLQVGLDLRLLGVGARPSRGSARRRTSRGWTARRRPRRDRCCPARCRRRRRPAPGRRSRSRPGACSAIAMQRPAKPEPMIATPHLADGARGLRGRRAGSRACWSPIGSFVCVCSGLLSNAQQATTASEQRSIRAPGPEEPTMALPHHVPHVPGRQVGADHRRRPRHRGRAGPQGRRPRRPRGAGRAGARASWPRSPTSWGPSTCGWRPTSPTPTR